MDAKQRRMINRELLQLQMQERKMEQAARKTKPAAWKRELERRIPEKAYTGLERAFCKGFSLVFQQGRALIEKTYSKETLQQEHSLRDRAVQERASRREFRQMGKSARRAGRWNLAATAAEGIALGALGVGMPDIVLFLSTLLKGIYETAIHYGFDYDSRQEQYLILKMMAASLQTGTDWVRENKQVEQLLQEDAFAVSEEIFQEQLRETAAVFAMDLLVLKFIQGMPIVGILGGAANPVYYRKVMTYVERKYKKRYLLRQRGYDV